jgi:hypothetical protein
MNERIQELALQAGAIKCHGYIPHPELDGHLIWAADAALDTKKMDAAKFAELIMKECAKVAWVGLTVAEMEELTLLVGRMDYTRMLQLAEAKLKELNT